MEKRTMRKLALFLFFFVACNSLFSQATKFYSLEQGLSSSLINQIYQDKKGFIWIATESGLNKFDGNKFVVYRKIPGDSTSLKNNYVQTLFEDSSGSFWVRCFGGLMKYDRNSDSFQEVEIQDENGVALNPSMGITSIIERKNGDVWFASTGLGLFSLKKGETICRSESLLNLRICSPYLTVIFEDSNNRLWIGSENSGLDVYSFDTDELLTYTSSSPIEKKITSNAISAICEGENHDIFVGTLDGGLNRFELSEMKIVHIHGKDGNKHLPVKELILTKSKQLFVGTDGFGMKIYNPAEQVLESYEPFSVPFDFFKAKVHTILEDRSGNLWMGIFQKGVFFIPANPNGFRYYGYKSFQKNSIGSNCVMAIHKDGDGIIWVGTDSDGLYAINEQTQEIKHYESSESLTSVPNTIICIYETNDGKLWLGSYLNGFALFDKKTGKCKYVNNRTNNLLSSNKIYCMTDDKKGGLWIGTYNGGLYKYDIASQSIVAHYYQPDNNDKELANNWINSLVYEEEGLLWIGTFNGLSCLNTKTNVFYTYRMENSNLPGNIIYALKKDRFNNIWIGTVEGLACLNKKTKEITAFTMQDGLPSNEVCAIEDDDKGNIWLSTLSGISRYSPTDNEFTNYYSSDGLQGNEFTRSAHYKSDKGEIFFGGINGITNFFPNEIHSKKGNLNVYITDFYLFGKPVHKGKKSGDKDILDTSILDASQIKLASYDNAFGIDLSILEYGNIESVSYNYYLENFDTEWKNTSPGNNHVTYANLNPGKYRFLFRANDMEIKSDIKSIEIIIRPPWYMTFWAKIIYTILLLLILYSIYWFVASRIKQRNEMLRLGHTDQIKEAKLQFFINISHEIRTPMTLIIGPLEKLLMGNNSQELQNTYLLIYRNAQRILRLVNQLMDMRKIDRGQLKLKLRETDMVGFIEDIMQAFDYMAKKKNIEFEFNHSMPELKVWIDLNNFDKVLFNVFSNAFKFTPDQGKITVGLTTGTDDSAAGSLRDYFEIKVMDTGIGIDKEKVNKIFERFYQIESEITNSNFGTGIGLHLTRSLVELQHGVIYAENRTDPGGSCFTIRMPMGNTHLREDEIDLAFEPLALKSPVYSSKNYLLDIDDEPEDLPAVRAKTRYRILIVEDDREISNYVKGELAAIYKIQQMTNGKEALEFILLEKPDLIISDIMMPEMDGITLCRKIKSNVNINHIPVILLTAKSDEKDLAEGLDTGADAYIKKPFNPEMLKKTIANIIGNRERLKSKSQSQSEGQIKQIEVKSFDEILMEKVIRIINENIKNPNLNGEMLSDGVGMSRVHMHRKLKELTNQSARDFIRTIRLQEAGKLLKNKKLTISQVHIAVGFTNLSHFSNSFKEFHGVSPREYMDGSYSNVQSKKQRKK
jgi:signal transduction histidine kinase/ligand-binding sensor domain-containing protein/DNA-binding NarL/FixJ family response regulator